MLSVSLSIFEIVALFVSAIVIGFAINLFFSSRKGAKKEEDVNEGKKSLSSGLDEWKIRYLKEAEIKDKEISDLKSRLHIAEENKRISEIEVQELNSQVRKLNLDLQESKTEKHLPQTRTD